MRSDESLEAPEVRRFLEAIHGRYGYDLRGYAPASIGRRVQAALHKSGLGDLGELERRSLEDPAVFGEVLGSLTVRVTEMFRDPSFYRALRREVVPRLRSFARFNVWCAGCATGEEAYSLAILLDEEGLAERAQIYATDLSAAALGEAKHGVYAAQRGALEARHQAAGGGAGDPGRFWTWAYGRVAIRDSILRNVVFFQHDLGADYVFGEMDLVFCRNVLIYFGRELQERVFGKLGLAVRPGGFLCLGGSERLSGSRRALFSELVSGQPIFKRSLSR